MKILKQILTGIIFTTMIVTSVCTSVNADEPLLNEAGTEDEAVKSQEVVNTIAEAVEHMADPEEFITWTVSELIKALFKENPMPGTKSEIEEIEEILNKVDTIDSKLDLLSEKINQQETAHIINEFKQFDNSNNAQGMVEVLSSIDKDNSLSADEKGAERIKLLLYKVTNTPEGSAVQDELYSTAFDGVYDQYKAFVSTKYINADNESMYIIEMYDRLLRTTDKWYQQYYQDKIVFQNYLVGKYMTVATMEKLSLTARIQEYEKSNTDSKARVLREKLSQIDKDVEAIQTIFMNNLAFTPDSNKRYYMYPGHELVIYAKAKEQVIPNEPNRGKGIQSELNWLKDWAPGNEPLSGLEWSQKTNTEYTFRPKISYWRNFVSYDSSTLCPTVEWLENVYKDYGSSKSLYEIFFDSHEGNLVKPAGSGSSWLFVADPGKGHEMKYQRNNFSADYVITPTVNSSGKDSYSIIYKYHAYSNEPVLDYKYIGIGVAGNSEIEDPENPGSRIVNYNYLFYTPQVNEEETETAVVVDYDTYKSELPAHSVLSINKADSKDYQDMKVHKLDVATSSNQGLLVQMFASQLDPSKKAKIVAEYSVYPRSYLSINENGLSKYLTWSELGVDKNRLIYAVCYNETDKAYLMCGVVSENGIAVFDNFIMRDMTNMTIFVLE